MILRCKCRKTKVEYQGDAFHMCWAPCCEVWMIPDGYRHKEKGQWVTVKDSPQKPTKSSKISKDIPMAESLDVSKMSTAKDSKRRKRARKTARDVPKTSRRKRTRSANTTSPTDP